MTNTVKAREFYYRGEIYAMDGAGTPEQALASVREDLASDGIIPPKIGSLMLVRDFFDGNPDPTDWYDVVVP